MKSRSSERIDKIIGLGWGAALKKDGYRRQGRTWYQQGEGVTRVANLQSSSINMYGMGRFTINFGIFFEAVASATAMDLRRATPKKYSPKEYYCHVRMRIGQLLPAKQGKWWEFEDESDLQAIADELVESWQKYGKPWLERLSDIRVARDEAILQKNYWLATQISVALGETQAARHWLGQLLTEYPHRNHDFFLTWAEAHEIRPEQDPLPRE